MTGQGRPRTSSNCSTTRCLAVLWLMLCACVMRPALGGAETSEPTLQLRIAWGSGEKRLWKGQISVSEGGLADPRPLGIEADEPGSMWIEDGRLRMAARSPREYDGVDLNVFAPLSARLIVFLWPDEAKPEKPIEIPLTELVGNYHNSSLDDRGNRLLVRRAPGDMLRVQLEPQRDSLVFFPAETLRLQLLPRLLGADSSKVRFEMELTSAKSGPALWSEERELTVNDATPSSVPLEIKLPAKEGVYDLTFTARTRNRLRLGWSDLAQRKLQLVVVEPSSLPAPPAGERLPVKLAEIDPAEPLNPAWWNRFAQLTMLPGFRNKGTLGTGESSPWQHPQLGDKLMQLGPGGREPNISWEAYPLPIDRPGEPHVLEIDYPSNVPQFLGISIIEPNSSGAVLPVGLDSGIYVRDEAAEEPPRLAQHRLIFWPRTRSPLVLLTNRRDGSRAVYGRMRVYGGQGRLPRAFARDEGGQRLWGAYMDRPLFPENFSAPDALDNWSGRSLDDWNTFYEGATRTADYLNHIGYNGLLLSVVADGSAIYPGKLLQPTPRYDTGVFFGTGQDPLRKDVLELLLRVFDREQLRLVPLVQFAAPLPELEDLLRRGGPEAVGVEWIDFDGVTFRQRNPPQRGVGAYYNPLNPRVQDAMLGVVRELAARYKDHPSLAGVAVDLSAEGFAILPGVQWGFDDVTVAAFQRAHPKLRIPGAGPHRFAERARYLTGEQRAAWVAWRAEELQEFYQRVRAELSQARPGLSLYLAGAGMFSGPESQEALRPQLPRKTPFDQAMIELGIGKQIETGAAGVWLRPQRLAPLVSLTAQGVNLEINQSVELDHMAAKASLPAALFYHEPQEARLESFDTKSPFKRTYAWLLSQPASAGTENRKRFIHALAAYDAQQMFDGGALVPLGQEASFKPLLAAFRQLPAEKFETVADTPQPVTLRTLWRGDQTWFYAVNDSPWNVTVRLPVSLPADCRLQSLETRRPTPRLDHDARGSLVTIHLEPYDLAGGWFTAGRVPLGRPLVELPNDALAQLRSRIDDLGARQSALSNPKPLEGWPKNQGFEESPALSLQVPGWSFPGRTATVDARLPHRGHQSIRLVRSISDSEAWLRSEPIPPPKTGRLAVFAWLRVADARQQPAVRLALQWQADGQPQYRYAAVGQSLSGEKEESVPENWKLYYFLVTDLPSAGVSQLRVRLDLMTPGEVWIDDVQLFDLIFDEEQRGERTELIKMIWHYTGLLEKRQVGDCLHFLESYWPRYLTTHVSLVNHPEVAALPPTAAQQKRPPAPAPQEDVKKPGFFERLKQYVPGRGWF